MPQYKMTYPYSRRFTDLGELAPGDVIDASENPNINFFEEVAAGKSLKTETSDN